MRYYPAAIALSLFAAVTSSMGQGATRDPDPRATILLAEGRAQLAAGDVQRAVDSFEAALVIDPAYSRTFIELAEAARSQGLQGKAIRYYREALEREPDNFVALSGEGAALAEKGAMEQAKANLSKLQSLCGESCGEVHELAAAIAKGPRPRAVTADATLPDPLVSKN